MTEDTEQVTSLILNNEVKNMKNNHLFQFPR